jgi:hypothetical protein
MYDKGMGRREDERRGWGGLMRKGWVGWGK